MEVAMVDLRQREMERCFYKVISNATYIRNEEMWEDFNMKDEFADLVGTHMNVVPARWLQWLFRLKIWL